MRVNQPFYTRGQLTVFLLVSEVWTGSFWAPRTVKVRSCFSSVKFMKRFCSCADKHLRAVVMLPPLSSGDRAMTTLKTADSFVAVLLANWTVHVTRWRDENYVQECWAPLTASRQRGQNASILRRGKKTYNKMSMTRQKSSFKFSCHAGHLLVFSDQYQNWKMGLNSGNGVGALNSRNIQQ